MKSIFNVRTDFRWLDPVLNLVKKTEALHTELTRKLWKKPEEKLMEQMDPTDYWDF